MMKKITFNMACSCVSRDIFGFNNEDLNDVAPPAAYEILQYINGLSFLFANTEGLSINKEEFLNKVQEFNRSRKILGNFWARCVFLALTKKYEDFLQERKSDYLIIDNGFVRLSLRKLSNGVTITDIQPQFLDFLTTKGLIPETTKKIRLDEIESEYAEQMIATFCRSLLTMYPANKIILIEVKPANLILDRGTGVFDEFCSDDEFNKLCALYKRYFKLLKKYLADANIIEAPEVLIADPYHKWGRLNLHFLKEYYSQYYIKCLEMVLQPQSSASALAQLKQNFDTYIYKNYLSAHTTSIPTPYSKLNRLYYENKFYYLKTHHGTIVSLDLRTFTLRHFMSYDLNYKMVKCAFIQNFLCLFIQIENKFFYIFSIDSHGNASLGLEQAKFEYIEKSTNIIAIKFAAGFLSARKDNSLNFMPWHRDWEYFKIIALPDNPL